MNAENTKNPWIDWHGGDCPVKGMPVGSVEARFRDLREHVLMTEPYYSCAALWQHTVPGSNGANIIAYRIIADQEARPTEKPNLYISSLPDFDQWWYEEGGNPPLPGHDCEEHTRHMCRIAWDNGAYKEAEKLAMTSGNNMPDRHELQKDGKHPAPCAKFCESNAYESQIRRLNNEASGLAEEINQQAMKMAAVERQRDELLSAIEEITADYKEILEVDYSRKSNHITEKCDNLIERVKESK